MSDVTLTSTTDTVEQITAALTPAGGATPVPAGSASTPDAPVQESTTPADEAGETSAQPEQQATVTTTDGKPPVERVTPYQKRINQLTAKASDAERQAATERETRLRLEGELAALRATAQPTQPATPVPNPAEPPATAPPAADADPEPQPDQFDTYEKYIDAKVQHKAQQIARDEIRRAMTEAVQAEHDRVSRVDADRAERERIAQFQKSFDTSRASHADFDAVVANDDIPLSLPMKEAILNHPLGGEVAYFLGTHPEEAARIAKLPIWVPTQGGGFSPTLLEVGRIIARVEAASTPGSAHAVPQSSAPPPIRPVGGRGASASTVPLDQTDYQTYKRLRDEATAGRRR